MIKHHGAVITPPPPSPPRLVSLSLWWNSGCSETAKRKTAGKSDPSLFICFSSFYVLCRGVLSAQSKCTAVPSVCCSGSARHFRWGDYAENHSMNIPNGHHRSRCSSRNVLRYLAYGCRFTTNATHGGGNTTVVASGSHLGSSVLTQNVTMIILYEHLFKRSDSSRGKGFCDDVKISVTCRACEFETPVRAPI